MTEKKPPFNYTKKLGDEIPSVTESIKFAHRLISVQRHNVTNDVIHDVIIIECDSCHLTNVKKLTMTTGSLN